MTSPPDDRTTDTSAIIASLRTERDAALSEKAALREELAARTAALAQRNTAYSERMEHQSATIDVLKAMSASPGDAQPVFDLITHRARQLCDGVVVGLTEFDGELVHMRSASAVIDPGAHEAVMALFPMRPVRGSIVCRAILERQLIHIRDAYAEPDLLQHVRNNRTRSILAIPLMRDDTVIGSIALNSMEPGGFSDSQIELLKTFAEQAVIAISSAETYRALQTRTSDLQETLEYQTAISDVLKVISSSNFTLEPVFQTVVDTAVRLCRADNAVIFRLQDGAFRWAAGTDLLPEYERRMRTAAIRPGTGTLIGRVALQGRPVQIVDEWTDPLYEPKDMARTGGVHTSLGVPLLRDGVTIGAIGLARLRIEPFTDRQIELVATFADQAVIAIENTRLITEQREALEQQTATAEVLQVINANPGDLVPVFNAILEKAHGLCDVTHGVLVLREGEIFRAVATHSYSGSFAEALRQGYRGADNPLTLALINGERFVHIPDLAQIDHPMVRASVELGGVRTGLFVPLRKDDVLLGMISSTRREIRPFSDKEIALVENFAAQAVIAMENARLLTETREALEQQTATAEVLQVINSSPGNLTPVFEAILEKAHNLCDVAVGSLSIYLNGFVHTAATRGFSEEYQALLRPPYPAIGSHQALMRGGPSRQTPDFRAQPVSPEMASSRYHLERMNLRTGLWVPLRKDGTALGCISAYRDKVQPFSEKEIALLENFAAQAVIAMENARLIDEQREALERQTATAEVLQVINASPGDLVPVFDAMLERALRLCGAAIGGVYRYSGQRFDTVALLGVTPAFQEYNDKYPMVEVRPGSLLARMIETRGPVQNPDVMASETYRAGSPYVRASVELGGIRAVLDVPLLKEGALLGFIAIYREEAGAFSDKQVALLEDFAAQAVIAMENARLITEQREALEQQTATAEVLQVINASPGNLAPVFDAILEKAHNLCGAPLGSLTLRDGEQLRAVATRGYPHEYEALARQGFSPTGPYGLLLSGEPFVHVLDTLTRPAVPPEGDPMLRAAVGIAGIRTALFVPLRKDTTVLGYISAQRQEVRLFTDKQIALLQNFAAQAVVAIENARLITEQREALEQQTATAEVLQVINSSPGDLAPVFDAMLDKGMRLCDAAFGILRRFDGKRMHTLATLGVPVAYSEYMVRYVSTPAPGTSIAEALNTGQPTQVLNMLEGAGYSSGQPGARAITDLGGARTVLHVPLVKDRASLGLFTLYRQEVRAFTDKQIALLKNFAAQAVIAMENARLLTEQQEALEQQTATAEVLQVINASPGDLAPVFDAVLEKAMRLCDAAFGILFTHDGDLFHIVAHRGISTELTEYLLRPISTSWEHTYGFLDRIAHGELLLHEADLADSEAYRARRRLVRGLVELGGGRTALWVALRKDTALLGTFVIFRREVRLFTDKQIALLQSFASQAVIAMENARLINETHEALEQQTATAEVLGVINSSPGYLGPVFDAILEKAHALCGAATGSLQLYDGEFFRAVATRGLPDEYANILRQPRRSDLRVALLRDAPFVQIADIADPVLTGGDKTLVAASDIIGVRTLLRVPLRKDDALLGLIVAGRREVRPFSQKEISLLQSFAAQAVIAMENARLLDEIRQRQAELRTTFDNMGDGVAMFDPDLRLAAWNRNFQQIIDLPDTILEARPSYADYLRLLAERGEFGTNDIEAELSLRIEDTDKELRLERVRPDGRVIEVRRNAVPGGGFVLIYSDITERKRSEEEIRAARDAAEATLRELRTAQANLIQAEKMASLGQLTAGIAHEIKNPLNFVNNFSALSTELIDELRDVLAPEPLGETARTEVDDLTALLKGNLEKVVQHGQRADGIVRSMLDHSRGSSGERRMVDLNALIDEALNLAYHGARAQDQSFNITLERDFGEGISPIEVNPQDITRVFLNLFSNGFYAATRRAREGGDAGFVPTLKVTTIDAGEAVEIRVRDNGIGIPGDIRDKLFQPFFTTKPTGEGTGLGLSITYDIVTQQHGGSIAVDSEVGDYSEFTVRLPRSPG